MTTSTYPVHVDADLDPGLNRGLWLVNWILAIPHFVVLILLWMAFRVVSVIAWFAILFTGSYPRAIFDFNVGVLRWSSRVAYYAFAVSAPTSTRRSPCARDRTIRPPWRSPPPSASPAGWCW